MRQVNQQRAERIGGYATRRREEMAEAGWAPMGDGSCRRCGTTAQDQCEESLLQVFVTKRSLNDLYH